MNKLIMLMIVLFFISCGKEKYYKIRMIHQQTAVESGPLYQRDVAIRIYISSNSQGNIYYQIFSYNEHRDEWIEYKTYNEEVFKILHGNGNDL